MKRFIAILLILTISCITLASCMPNLQKYAVRFADEKIDVSLADMRNEEYLAFLDKLEDFSSKMTASTYDLVGKGSNFCISPVSIYMALAIACEVTEGETRQEILDAVGVTYEEVVQFTKYLYAFHNKEYKYTNTFGGGGVSAREELSNSLWMDTGSIYNLTCVERLASDYNCDIFSASFKDGTAKKMINQYIEYKTHGVVNGNLDFSKDTFFSIINTFYLKEIWNELGKNLTLTLEYYEFENSNESITKTQLLKGYHIPGKAYEDQSFSSFYTETQHGYRLHFIVPAEGKRLIDVFNEKNISKILSIENYGYIDHENQQLHHTRIYFPEFSASFSGNLKNILGESFGVSALFNEERCDFSPLFATPAFCESIIHKCELNVSAKGIEGAAITAMQGATSPAPPEYEEVFHDYIIDKNFGFVLTDAYGTVLFSGAISTLD